MRRLIPNFQKSWPCGIIEFNATRFSEDKIKINKYYEKQFLDHVNTGDNFYNDKLKIEDMQGNIDKIDFFTHETQFNQQLNMFGGNVLKISINKNHLEKYNEWLNLILSKQHSLINPRHIIPRILLRCHRNLYEDWISDIPNREERLKIDFFDRYLTHKNLFSNTSKKV